jgi:hypothetical protein
MSDDCKKWKMNSLQKIQGVLIDDKDIELRLKILTAFQLYMKTLMEITNGTESPELDATSKSLGKGFANHRCHAGGGSNFFGSDSSSSQR